MPGGGLRANHGGHVGEFANDAAQSIDGVSAGDGEGVGAQLVVPLPGAAGVTGQDALAHQPDVAGHDTANVAVSDKVAEVDDGRVGAGLQANDGFDPLLAGEVGHLDGLISGAAQGPFGEGVLAGAQGGHGGLVVAGHAQGYGGSFNVGVGQHTVVVVPRAAGVEGGPGFVGRFLTGGADGGEVEVGVRGQGRQVSAGRPAHVNVGADESDLDRLLGGHGEGPPVVNEELLD